MPHHARPAAEREQRFLDQFILAGRRRAEPVEFGGNHVERGLPPDRGERLRQPGVPRLRRPESIRIEIDDGGEEAPLAARHRPGGDALVEIGRTESDEERVHKCIGVERRIDRDDKIPQPYRRPHMRGGGPGERGGLHAGMPEIGRGRPLDCVALRERPPHGHVFLLPHRMPQQLQEQRLQRHPSTGEQLPTGRPKIGLEHGYEVCIPNPADGKFLAVPRLGEKRLRAVDPRGMHDRLFKRLVFEALEDVLGDEDVDRPLRRQIAGRTVERLLNLLGAVHGVHRHEYRKRPLAARPRNPRAILQSRKRLARGRRFLNGTPDSAAAARTPGGGLTCTRQSGGHTAGVHRPLPPVSREK